ncbi:MAG: phosphodiester glycosidase family protein [Myxococcota bacterium]
MRGWWSMRSPPLLHALTLLLALTSACDRTKAPQPPPTSAPAPPVDDVSSPDPAEEEAPRYEGDGPVQLAPPEPLMEAEGFTLERQAWRFGEREGWAWRARVARPGSAKVLAKEELTMLPEFSLGTGATPFAALNGGFYEHAEDPKPMGVVVTHGDKVKGYQKRGGSGVFVVIDGQSTIVHRDQWAQFAKRNPTHALQSIDRIVADGKTLVKQREGARSAARAAVVLGERDMWLIALADRAGVEQRAGGALQLRASSYLGLPLWAFAEYIVASTDVIDALNLDGGVSTQMLVKTPTAEFVLRGERGTMSAVTLSPPPE